MVIRMSGMMMMMKWVRSHAMLMVCLDKLRLT